MNYIEDDFLQLSGLQHYLYCPRQWALIHIEQQWVENIHTVLGNIMHEGTHNEFKTEKRGKLLITRGMQVASFSLGISGQCDVLEFHQEKNGISLYGWEGMWKPFPVEYKKGEPKEASFDEAQLCGQAMCLEEMLCCHIEEGALFYGKNKRRTIVSFSEELRQLVKNSCFEMHKIYQRGWTPNSKKKKKCSACSLKNICIPPKNNMKSVKRYYEDHYLCAEED